MAVEGYFVSKTAAAVLAFAGWFLCSIPMSAQFNGLLPSGNVYAGVSYGQLSNVVIRQSYRGWNGSYEALPFSRFPRIGLVADVSGFYRSGGLVQYNFLGGPRVSTNLGKWRPFIHGMSLPPPHPPQELCILVPVGLPWGRDLPVRARC